jgi:CubicO group peptidase (beta-lactamase class C family)
MTDPSEALHMAMSPAALERLHAAMAARVDHGELPGLVILLATDDGTDRDVHVDPIGVTAFGGTEPMRRDTLFRIASMTKPVLAAATLTLVEDGTLALDEPVDRLLPELADRRVLRRVDGPLTDTVAANRPITVEDLLTFRMGHGLVFEPSFQPPYPVIEAADELELRMAEPDPRTPHAPDEWLARFATLPLMYQPGERWQYNTGSLVLGVLLARATGKPLWDVFATRVLGPLGMTETGFWLPAERTAGLPTHYMTNFATGKLAAQTLSTPAEWSQPPVFPSGAAGLLSTADDYLTFARMLLHGGVHDGGRLLTEKSVELMTTNRLTPEQIATAGVPLGGGGWGYCAAVATEPDEVSDRPGRYGWDGGYGSGWFNDPNRGLVAMMLSQTSDVLFNGVLAEFKRLAARV